jgi:hypothetical protein
MPKIEHAAQGDPCRRCGLAASRHRRPRKRQRLWHKAQGDPCTVCGKPASAHPTRKRLRARKRYDAARDDRQAARYIVGVDGEGHDTSDGRHIYTYLCAVDEHGRTVAEARDPEGLSHDACVTMLLSIPRRTLKFGFAFGYDATKIIEGLSVEDRYRLVRPDARRGYVCKRCAHRWTLRTRRVCNHCGSRAVRSFGKSLRIGGRRYDYLRGSLTVADRDGHVTRVWDAHKFFQSSFVYALESMDIGEPIERARVATMKALRPEFAAMRPADIEDYCRLECKLLAQMMRAVVSAHQRLGLRLVRYDGAGASAAAMLKAYGVERFKGPRLESLPAGLRDAVMRASFGGRFEHAIIGRYEQPVHGFDVTAAYPASLVDLPCLRCGDWEHVTGRGVMRAIERADLAVARFTAGRRTLTERRQMIWAPLPCRDASGSLVFGTGFSGWAWKPELLPATAGWPDLVEVHEAWVYRTPCDHKPFAFMEQAYAERVRLGKDAAGKVLKNTMNACGGKLLQGVGSARYRSVVWSGNMTAQTRGWVLDVLARDGDDVLTVSADGICASRDLGLEREGLGGWTHQATPGGAFFVRPGLYFQLDREDARARGLGRGELLEAAPDMLRAWSKWDRESFDMGVAVPARRFFGAKHAIIAMSRCRCGASWPGTPTMGCPVCGRLGLSFKAGEIRAGVYGTWQTHTTVVGFDPFPKRERMLRKTGDWAPLVIRDLGGAQSIPYVPGKPTPEAEGSRELREMADDAA